MDWFYVTFKDGQLFDDDGCLIHHAGLRWATWQDAQAWLEDNDVRATIR